MKRILFAVVLMFSGSLLLANGQSPTRPGSSSSKLTISEYGALLTVQDANDKGSVTLKQAGFRLSYKLDGNKLKTVWASAAGGLRPGQIKVDGNSASVTVTTDDGALEITNEFTFDDERKQLIIRRTLKNNSAKKVRVQQTENLDAKLLGTSKSMSLEDRALQRVKGRGCDDPKIERPPSHPCISICPNVHWPGLRLLGKAISFNWSCPNTVDPGKEVRFELQLDLR